MQNNDTVAHPAEEMPDLDTLAEGPSKPMTGQRRPAAPLFRRFAIPKEWRAKDTGGGT